MPKLAINPGWREQSTLTEVRLPDGSTSGGLLTDRDAGGLLLLFSREDLDRGDRIVAAHGLVLTVTAVDRGTLTGQAVTALQVCRSGTSH